MIDLEKFSLQHIDPNKPESIKPLQKRLAKLALNPWEILELIHCVEDFKKAAQEKDQGSLDTILIKYFPKETK